MKNVWLVAKRELAVNLLKKSAVISTVIMLALIVGGIFVMDYFINKDAGETPLYEVAVTTDAAPLTESLYAAASAAGAQLSTFEVDVSDPLEVFQGDDVESDADAFAAVGGSPAAPIVAFANSADEALVAIVTQAAQSYVVSAQLTALGGDPVEFSAALAAATPQVEIASPGAGFDGPTYFFAIIMLSLMMFGLMQSGSLISMGVVEEKTSRVVEILLATIKPSQLFAGKILGIGLIALIDLALYAAAFVAATQASGLFEGYQIEVGPQLLGLLGWFVLGFFLYAIIWGALSALVSRQEDVGSVTAPMIFAVLIPFYVAIYLVPNQPDSVLTANLSMAPLLAPFLMPVRAAFVAVPGWQYAVAIGLNAALVPVLIWAAARIYHRGVLHTGSRMKLAEVFRRR